MIKQPELECDRGRDIWAANTAAAAGNVATLREYPRIVKVLCNAGATMSSRAAGADLREGW
jgi:hypothetical protein